MSKTSSLAVIVPLFPHDPALQRSLSALRNQTRLPDLVVLLEDSKKPAAEAAKQELGTIPVEVIETDTTEIADAINRAVDSLEQTEYFAILGAGAVYSPRRLERCLEAMEDPSRFRPPGLVVTGVDPTDAKGARLPDDDERRAQIARLWAPGRAGIGIPDWLGGGDFVLSPGNLFARRAYLRANPLIPGTSSFAYQAAIQAGVQGQLEVVDEPLLELHWSAPERHYSTIGAAACLRAQIRVLGALREKLETSTETRRNFASFHRAAWYNASGLREDLFARAALHLASLAPAEDMVKIVDRLSASGDAGEPLQQAQGTREKEALADPIAYATALAQARSELQSLKSENERLQRVADASQESGWVRFGAWLGDRGARRIMEMDAEENSIQPPNGEVERGGENNPQQIRNEQP